MDQTPVDVDHPGLRDTGPPVTRRLDREIIPQGRVGDLDDEERIPARRLAIVVEARDRKQQADVMRLPKRS